MLSDPLLQVEIRRQELLGQADHERLVAQVPARSSAVRHAVAKACYRLADWLSPTVAVEYFRQPDPGRVYWARVR